MKQIPRTGTRFLRMGALAFFLGLLGCTRREEPHGPPPPEIVDAVEAARRAWTDPDVYTAWLRYGCELARIRLKVPDIARADEFIRMVSRYAPPPSKEAAMRADRALGGVGLPAGMEACEVLADPVALDSAKAVNGDPSLERPPLPRSQRRQPGEPPRP